jgi:hypothetical protein
LSQVKKGSCWALSLLFNSSLCQEVVCFCVSSQNVNWQWILSILSLEVDRVVGSSKCAWNVNWQAQEEQFSILFILINFEDELGSFFCCQWDSSISPAHGLYPL